MRIANATIVRNYTDSLTTNLARLNRAQETMDTGRKFNSFGEDPASAVRAMQIRRSLARIDGYKDNIKTLQSKYNAAEDAVKQLSARANEDILGLYVQALSTDKDGVDYGAIAKELEGIRDNILDLMNTRFGGEYLFGGTNATGQPLNYDAATGKLTYNGYPIEDISKGHPALTDANFVDIGLGMVVDKNTGVTDPTTAFTDSIRAIDYIGYGEDNLIYVLDRMIQSCKDGEPTLELREALDGCLETILVGLTGFGANTNYLDYTAARLEDDQENLIKRQDAIEFLDFEDSVMQFKLQEFVYNASLQMGQRLLYPSLFTYLS